MFAGKKNRRNEFLAYVMTGIIVIVTLFGCINVYKSCKIINKQAESNLVYLAEEVKQKGNDYFQRAQGETEHCRNAIEITINSDKLQKLAPISDKYNKNEIPYVEAYLNSFVGPLFRYSTSQIKNLVSIYFVLDPPLLPNKDLLGLWYADLNVNGNFTAIDNGRMDTMYPETREDLQWFYSPKAFKKGIWSAPYVDPDLKINMITYSTPIYSGKKFQCRSRLRTQRYESH